MIIQLHDPIPVTTPLGPGYAVIFEGEPNDNYWTVILDNGAFVTFTQQKIKAARSYTHHRIPDDEMRAILERSNGDDLCKIPSAAMAPVAGRRGASKLSRKPASARVSRKGAMRRRSR